LNRRSVPLLAALVAPGGNAEKAGLRGGSADNYLVSGGRTIFLGGDIILSIGGQAVWTLMTCSECWRAAAPGRLWIWKFLGEGRSFRSPWCSPSAPVRR